MKPIMLLPVIVMMLLTATRVLGCSCVNTSPDILFDRADVVFAGRVSRVEGRKVTFEVERSWKYARSKWVTVYYLGEGSCRMELVAGDRLIVHAVMKDGLLYTEMCMGIDSADEPSPRFAALLSRETLPVREGSIGNGLSESAKRVAVAVTAGAVILLLLLAFLFVRSDRGRAA